MLLVCTLLGCSKASTSQTRKTETPTIASLAPAATDLLIAMGAADHLVAVSSFDPARPETAGMPNAGDYQNTNWETLAAVHPGVIVVQMEASRIPAGLRQRAGEIKASLVDIQIENLGDIFKTIDQLGGAIHSPESAVDAGRRLHHQLDVVRDRVKDLPAVPTLICLNETGTFAAGPGTFLDELLTLAGGKNVLDASSPHWPTIDRERLIALSPQAVIDLLPGATPQVLQTAKDFWAGLPGDIGKHVTIITDPTAMTPGYEVGTLAEEMAKALHPANGPQASCLPEKKNFPQRRGDAGFCPAFENPSASLCLRGYNLVFLQAKSLRSDS